MELGDTALVRLIAGVVVVAIFGGWAAAIASQRRRERRFFALARALGAEPVRESKYLIRAPLRLGERTVDLRYQHLGGGRGGAAGWTPDWYLVTGMPLRGVSQLLATTIRPRSQRRIREAAPDAAFSEHFDLRDAGYPLPGGWPDDTVRKALLAFYRLDLPLEPLVLEEAALLHRTRRPLRHWTSDALRELIDRQLTLTSALERTL